MNNTKRFVIHNSELKDAKSFLRQLKAVTILGYIQLDPKWTVLYYTNILLYYYAHCTAQSKTRDSKPQNLGVGPTKT